MPYMDKFRDFLAGSTSVVFDKIPGASPLGFLILLILFLLLFIPTLILTSYSMFIKISRGVVAQGLEIEMGQIAKVTAVTLLGITDFIFVGGGIAFVIFDNVWAGIGMLIMSIALTWPIIVVARSVLRKLLNPEYLRTDWDTTKARRVFRESIKALLEGTVCSGLGAAGIYFIFWQREYLLAGFFLLCTGYMLWHFRRSARRMIANLGFPLEVRVSYFE